MSIQHGADHVAIADKPDPTKSTGEVMKQLSEEQREILRELRRLREELKQREQASRSFWRAVLDALWSGVTQAHNTLKGIIKE